MLIINLLHPKSHASGYTTEFSRNTQSWQCCHLCISHDSRSKLANLHALEKTLPMQLISIHELNQINLK